MNDSNNNLQKYFKIDEDGFYHAEKDNKYKLRSVKNPYDKTRYNKATEQSKLPPCPISQVFAYINEFLELIRDDNGFEEKIIQIDTIKLGEREHVIRDNGILIRDNKWRYPHWNDEKRTYDIYDEKYDVIKERFKLERISDILWFKFTNKGHLAVVAKSCDINWNYDNSSGILVDHVNELFDDSFVLVFPLTQEMVRTKDDPNSKKRKYLTEQLERGIGNYLIDKGVPIIDFFSHMA